MNREFFDQFTTYAVIEFEDNCTRDIKEYLQTKLTSSRLDNGSELLTKFTKNFEDKEVFLHIGATDERLLKGAELIGLKKTCKNGQIKEFLVDDLENFEGSDDMDNFLTQADRLKIIDDEINNMKLNHDEVKFENNVYLYKYDGIINQLIKQKAIYTVFSYPRQTNAQKLGRYLVQKCQLNETVKFHTN